MQRAQPERARQQRGHTAAASAAAVAAAGSKQRAGQVVESAAAAIDAIWPMQYVAIERVGAFIPPLPRRRPPLASHLQHGSEDGPMGGVQGPKRPDAAPRRGQWMSVDQQVASSQQLLACCRHRAARCDPQLHLPVPHHAWLPNKRHSTRLLYAAPAHVSLRACASRWASPMSMRRPCEGERQRRVGPSTAGGGSETAVEGCTAERARAGAGAPRPPHSQAWVWQVKDAVQKHIHTPSMLKAPATSLPCVCCDGLAGEQSQLATQIPVPCLLIRRGHGRQVLPVERQGAGRVSPAGDGACRGAIGRGWGGGQSWVWVRAQGSRTLIDAQGCPSSLIRKEGATA